METLFSNSGLGASVANHLGVSTVMIAIILAIIALWSIVWKGVALWFAARNHQKNWFIIILVLNTLGILEIVYLLWFRRDKQEGVTTSLFNNPLPSDETEEVASAPEA